jgi:zinc transport system permease protein
MSKGYAVNLFSYLFGNILAVSRFDLMLMTALSAFIIVSVALLFKEFLILTFDEEYAAIVGIRTQALSIFLLCLIALSIVVMIKIVGVILVIALLTIPASIGRLFSKTVKRMMVISTLCGILLTTTGLVVSYYTDLASGATIVLLSAAAFVAASAVKRHDMTSSRVRALQSNKP